MESCTSHKVSNDKIETYWMIVKTIFIHNKYMGCKFYEGK